MDLKTIMGAAMILFAINIVTLGLGLADDTWIDKMKIIDQTPGELAAQQSVVDINYTVVGSSEATDDYDKLPTFEAKSGVSKYSTFKKLILGLVAGYTAILVNIGLPMLILWLLVGLVSIFQVVALFYLAAYIVSMFTGAKP